MGDDLIHFGSTFLFETINSISRLFETKNDNLLLPFCWYKFNFHPVNTYKSALYTGIKYPCSIPALNSPLWAGLIHTQRHGSRLGVLCSTVDVLDTGYPSQFSHIPLRCSGQVSAQGFFCVQGHHIHIQCGYAISFFVRGICRVTSNLWIPVRLDLLEQLIPCNLDYNYLTKLTSLSQPNSSLDKLFVLCFILKT